MTVYTLRRVLILSALAVMLGVVGVIVTPAAAGAGGYDVCKHKPWKCSTTTTEQVTTTTVAPTTTTVPETTTTLPPVTITVPTTSVPPTTDPKVYECDGTGDGVNESGYEDPTDGVCEWDLPDEETTVPSQPPTCPTADDPACDITLSATPEPPVAVSSAGPLERTLPNTGSSSGVLAAAAVLLIAIGGGLVATTRRT